MPDKKPETEATEAGIRSRVIERTLESLSSTESDLGEGFLDELRGLLGQEKPPKADAFVTLFEKDDWGQT